MHLRPLPARPLPSDRESHATVSRASAVRVLKHCYSVSRGERSATDRRDFTDRDLADRRIEEGLDVLEAAGHRGGLFAVGLLTAGSRPAHA